MLVNLLKPGGGRSCPPHELRRVPAYRRYYLVDPLFARLLAAS